MPCSLLCLKGLISPQVRPLPLISKAVHINKLAPPPSPPSTPHTLNANASLVPPIERQAELMIVLRLLSFPQAEKLLKQSSRSDALLVLVWNKIGDHHADRQNWYRVHPQALLVLILPVLC